MRLIRVTYRATFQQPLQGPLNPMGLKLTMPLQVEVYKASKDRWLARIPRVGSESSDPLPLTSGSTAEQMRLNVVQMFQTQLTPWELWGNPGTAMDRPRLLSPGEVEIRENGQVYMKY